MSHHGDTDVNWAEWQLTCDKARELAATMTNELTGDDVWDWFTVEPPDEWRASWPVKADLVEWCRSARDVLEAIGHE